MLRHVQNFVVNRLSGFQLKQNEISITFELWRKYFSQMDPEEIRCQNNPILTRIDGYGIYKICGVSLPGCLWCEEIYNHGSIWTMFSNIHPNYSGSRTAMHVAPKDS